jgi:hypothetical protein
VPDSLRATFEVAWADASIVDPVVMVRRVLETPVSWRGLSSRVGHAQIALPIGSVAACLPALTPEAQARQRLLVLAVDARARGAAVRRARFYSSNARADWARALLGTPPWRSDLDDGLLEGLRASVLTELANQWSAQGVVPVVPGAFRASAETCVASSR